MTLTNIQKAIFDLIYALPIRAGKSTLIAYLYIFDKDAHKIVNDLKQKHTESPCKNCIADGCPNNYICNERKLYDNLKNFESMIICVN